MAIIEFEDGKRVKFDGTPTQADIEEAYAQISGGQPKQQAPQSSPHVTMNADNSDSLIQSGGMVNQIAAGLNQGAVDAGQGLIQAAKWLGNKVGLVSDESLQGTTDQFNQERADYEAGRDTGGVAPTTAGSISRFAGNAAVSMAMPAGAASATTGAARIGAAALGGGASGFTQFAQDDTDRARNTLIGAATGTIVGSVAEGLRYGANYVQRQVQKAYKSQSAEMLAEAQAAQRLGIQLPHGAATGNAELQGLEREAFNYPKSQEAFKNRYNAITSAAVNRLEQLARPLNGLPVAEQGEVARQIGEAYKSTADAIYKQAKTNWDNVLQPHIQAYGGRPVFDLQNVRQTLGELLADARANFNGPEGDAVLRRLEAIETAITPGARSTHGTQTLSLEQMTKALSEWGKAARDGRKSFTLAAIKDPDLRVDAARRIYSALKDDLGNVLPGVDSSVATAVKQARGQYFQDMERHRAVTNSAIGKLFDNVNLNRVAENSTDFQAVFNKFKSLGNEGMRESMRIINQSNPRLQNMIGSRMLSDAIAAAHDPGVVPGQIKFNISKLMKALPSSDVLNEVMGRTNARADLATTLNALNKIQHYTPSTLKSNTTQEAENIGHLAASAFTNAGANIGFIVRNLFRFTTPTQIGKALMDPMLHQQAQRLSKSQQAGHAAGAMAGILSQYLTDSQQQGFPETPE